MSKEISLFKTLNAFLAINLLRFIKRDRPPPRVPAAADLFDDYRCEDYIDSDYSDF